MGLAGPAHRSRRPAGHTGPGQSPAPHLGLEPGRSGKAAAALAPRGPKALRGRQGCGLEASAPRPGPGQVWRGWLAGPALGAEAADSARETSPERCLLGLRHSPQISARTCGGDSGDWTQSPGGRSLGEEVASGEKGKKERRGKARIHSAMTGACYGPSPILGVESMK